MAELYFIDPVRGRVVVDDSSLDLEPMVIRLPKCTRREGPYKVCTCARGSECPIVVYFVLAFRSERGEHMRTFWQGRCLHCHQAYVTEEVLL